MATGEGFWATQRQMHEVTPERARSARTRLEALVEERTRAKQHLWIANVAWLVTPPLVDQTSLDMENLLSAPVIGCFICEDAYDRGRENTRCPGDPQGRLAELR
jgi:hypothetical protein